MDGQEWNLERATRVKAQFDAARVEPALSLCQASASVLGVAGAGIILVSRGRTLGNLCVSNQMAEAAEEVQYALGEGPSMDAFASKMPVLVPDLASPEMTRWSGFREGALGAGVRAAFGFPLLIGTVCIGALNLYNDRAGELTTEQCADAVTVADVIASNVLTWQSHAKVGTLAWQLEQVPSHRAVVHQASGMVSVQAGVSVNDGLDLLRAHAFAEGQTLGNVAADVVARLLSFRP
jgi:transcriptional regulator with GAF, ATPase, and Fis domain